MQQETKKKSYKIWNRVSQNLFYMYEVPKYFLYNSSLSFCTTPALVLIQLQPF